MVSIRWRHVAWIESSLMRFFVVYGYFSLTCSNISSKSLRKSLWSIGILSAVYCWTSSQSACPCVGYHLFRANTANIDTISPKATIINTTDFFIMHLCKSNIMPNRFIREKALIGHRLPFEAKIWVVSASYVRRKDLWNQLLYFSNEPIWRFIEYLYNFSP